MPTFKLDDQEIPFEPGDTILRAAHRSGVDIPHYCWHPGLAVAANCRMCLVELEPPPGRRKLMLDVVRWDEQKQEYVPEQKPKLVPACQQTAGDGMVVLSQASEHVRHARRAVQELLLLNHPVDCPICDQAGECRLQDYWLEHQAEKKRMRDEPVHKPKAVSFGPTIVYDAERCIVCTRCVRFCEEVAKDPVLSVRERGNLNEIVVSPGRELDHPYTLMTEHVCPVGALTAKDFRFKARVWFLRSARSVCQGCATGCNAWLDYDPRDQTVYRHRPRENAQVNQFWMCDEGMLSYRAAHEARVTAARVDGEASDVRPALDVAAKRLSGVGAAKLAVVFSAHHSQEDNFALLTVARGLGVTRLVVDGRPGGQGDDVLRDADKNPNRRGVLALLGDSKPTSVKDLLAAIEKGEVEAVLALGTATEADSLAAVGKVAVRVVVSAHEGPWASVAQVLLPATTWAESDGTFVNRGGLAQESEAAVAPAGEAREGWRLVSALGRRLGLSDLAWSRREHVLAAMSPSQETAATAGAAE